MIQYVYTNTYRIVACNATNYYIAVNRTPTLANLYYTNVLATFKVEFEAYEQLQKETAPMVLEIRDSDNERKVIKWTPIVLDCMFRTYRIKRRT